MSQEKLNDFYSKHNATEYHDLMENLNIGKQSIKREKFFSNFNFKGLKVLEIGVGQGYNLEFYKNAKAVVGIDINTSMLDICRREIISQGLKKKVSIVEWDARLLYTEFVGKFDVVIMTYALSGAPNQEKILENVIKYCKKGGIIGILDWATLFRGNKYFKDNKLVGFFQVLKNKLNYKKTGFSNHINPWNLIFDNRDFIKIIKNDNYDEDYMNLILQKK